MSTADTARLAILADDRDALARLAPDLLADRDVWRDLALVALDQIHGARVEAHRRRDRQTQGRAA